MRRPLVAGNWKMHGSRQSVEALLSCVMRDVNLYWLVTQSDVRCLERPMRWYVVSLPRHLRAVCVRFCVLVKRRLNVMPVRLLRWLGGNCKLFWIPLVLVAWPKV